MIPVRSVEESRGFLKGIETTVKRGGADMKVADSSGWLEYFKNLI